MIDFYASDVTTSGVLFLEDTMSKGMRTEDEVRDSAKLVLGFDKTEDGVQKARRGIRTFAHQIKIMASIRKCLWPLATMFVLRLKILSLGENSIRILLSMKSLV